MPAETVTASLTIGIDTHCSGQKCSTRKSRPLSLREAFVSHRFIGKLKTNLSHNYKLTLSTPFSSIVFLIVTCFFVALFAVLYIYIYIYIYIYNSVYNSDVHLCSAHHGKRLSRISSKLGSSSWVTKARLRRRE